MKNNNLSLAGLLSATLAAACAGTSIQVNAATIVDINFDENSGMTAADNSGLNNHATFNNAVWTQGKNGSGAYFNGTDAYAELANEKTAPLYNIHKGNHTIAAWVKPEVRQGHRSGLVTRWGVHQGLFLNADGTFTFKHRTPTGTQTVTSPTPYDVGEFYHVAATIDGDAGKLKLYVNGELVATRTYAAGDHATQNFYRPWRIGVKDVSKTTANKRENFAGSIDEVMFFDVPLTAEEIDQRWGAGSNKPPRLCSLGPDSGSGTGSENTVLEIGDKKSGSFISFEQAEVPQQFTTDIGILSMNGTHAKHGNKSLQWQWSDGAVLEVDDLIGLGLNPNIIDKTNYTQSSFRMWLHSDAAVDGDPLRVEFYDDAGDLQYQYYVNLNFTGWRAASVKYRTDMTGDKANKNLTKMKIHAPAATCQGTLLVDFLDFTADKGVVTGADYQVPMAATGNTNHWTSNLYFESYTQPAMEVATAEQLADAEAMKQKFIDNELTSSAGDLANANMAFDNLGIQYDGVELTAQVPLFGPYHSGFGVRVGVVDDVIFSFAKDYLTTGNIDSQERFTLLVRYLLQQGFAAGSSMENSSHIGYSTRNISKAILLMESTLREAGLWTDAHKALAWYNTVAQIWQPAADNVSNSDHARTRIPAMLGVILHIDDPQLRVHYLKGYQRHIEDWLTVYGRGDNGVKPDYSSFHHNTHYPGYVYGALNALSGAINNISHSQFAIATDKFELATKMALSYAVHHGGKDMPLSLSGRNPFKVPSVGGALLNLGKATDDPALQARLFAAYNRLYAANDTTSVVAAEENPQGFWQFNYRPTGVYRHDNWVANIKGLSKYFWGTEIYTKDNRFGRYQSYGSVFVHYQPSEENKGVINYDGVTQDGWDWNKMPGTTSKLLPWQELQAAKTRQDEWADGTFSAALRFDTKDADEIYVDGQLEGECGIHGLDFKQRGSLSPSHEDTFTFKKSVFACEGVMIALGSNINSLDGQNSVVTNLFQSSTAGAPHRLVENNATRPQSDYTAELNKGDNWLIDPYGTGYLVKEGDPVAVNIGQQSSPYHRENTVSFTEGHFASAWIDHGLAPDNAQYHYVIVPNATHKQMNELAKEMRKQDDDLYSVIQQNNDAHIVAFDEGEEEAYVIFSANTPLSGQAIYSSDTPILAAAELDDGELELSLVNPDHAFTGKAPRWGDSQAQQVTVTLNGHWQLSLGSVVDAITLEGDKTLVTVTTKDGAAVDVNLFSPEVLEDEEDD